MWSALRVGAVWFGMRARLSPPTRSGPVPRVISVYHGGVFSSSENTLSRGRSGGAWYLHRSCVAIRVCSTDRSPPPPCCSPPPPRSPHARKPLPKRTPGRWTWRPRGARPGPVVTWAGARPPEARPSHRRAVAGPVGARPGPVGITRGARPEAPPVELRRDAVAPVAWAGARPVRVPAGPVGWAGPGPVVTRSGVLQGTTT
jgi:hypothetical protein